jgi:Holliday junction resolvase RusA-like endonuclease
VSVSFTVVGIVAGKGSKSAFVVRRKGVPASATGAKAFRAVVTDRAAHGKADRYGDWKAAVTFAALRVAGDHGLRHAPLDGPLEAVVTFYFAPPKSETRAERTRTWFDKPIDVEKALRSLFDPLKGLVIADDARIARVVAEKRYARNGRAPGADVTITRLHGTE